MFSRRRLLYLLFSYLTFLPLGFTEPVRTPHVTAELLAEYAHLQPGAEAWIGLRMEMEPHWHTYWEFPGDSGLPTKVEWQLPPGWKISGIHWPLPSRIPLPPLVNFGYEGEALLGFRLTVPAGAKPGSVSLVAKASWLVCKEECVPESATLRLNAEVKPAPPPPRPWRAAFEKLRAQQPRSLPQGALLAVHLEPTRVGIRLDNDPAWLKGNPDFFPLTPMLTKGEAPQLEKKGGEWVLWMQKATPFDDTATELKGVLVGGPEAFAFAAPLPAMAASKDLAAPASGSFANTNANAGAEPPSFLLAVVFAFVGGLILNLMPCVFPVLGIKVMSLVTQGAGDRWHSRWHGKAYALGVVVSFWVLTALLLGFRAAGQSVGWGFQLQQPGFVLFLIYLFSLLAANLAGAFEIGGRWLGAGSGLASRDDYAGSFFTGVLAVVVATPCTAPFMGTAIGVVLGQPAWLVFLVFTALALGLAAPFVFLSYQPALLRLLPRPGPWMARLKEFFAFPMAATVLWLLWVLGKQKGLDGAFAASLAVLLLGGAIWASRFGSRFGRVLAALLLVASLGLSIAVAILPGPQAAGTGASNDWAPYSEAGLEKAAAEGRPAFVDFTAAWCITCQVNKGLVLDRAPVREFFREKNVALFRADWTNQDPVITAALERQGRIGVPLYLTYRGDGSPPLVLPQILSEKIVRDSFQKP